MYHLIMLPAGLLIGLLLFICLPRLKTFNKAPDVNISVVIPARNEAHNIAGIISDLRSQSMQPYEIICIDDDSSDETASLAAKAGAKVVKAGEKPDEWVGKTWASQKGAEVATGDLLLFLDADVRLAPNALARLAALHHQSGGVVSVQPYHTVKRFYEHFAMFFNIVAVAATGIGLPFMKRPAGMFGPVTLMSRALYMQHGGHERVKSKVLEDFLLGKYYAKNDIPITLLTGKKDISYRMYKGGFRELWQGFTKNFFTGAVSASFPLLLLVIIWITALTSAVISMIRAAVIADSMLWYYLLFYGLFTLHTLYISKQVGNFSWLASLFYPVFLLGFHIIFLASVAKRLVFKRVTWKGRQIETKGSYHADC